MLAVPVISRSPLPDDDQAILDTCTQILTIDPRVPDHALHRFVQDAILVLAGLPHLAVYARRTTPAPRPALRVIRGGRCNAS